MLDNFDYRAANGRAQPAASGLLSGFRRTENRSLQRFVRSGAARELPAVPVTALSNVAVSPTANRLVSIPMVFIPIHCNGPRHAMHWYAMDSNALNTNAFHAVPSGRRPGERMKVTVQTCGDLPTIGPIVEGQPSTVFPLQTVSVPSNVNSYG